MKLKIKKLHPSIPTPRYATAGAAGLDLHAAKGAIVAPGGRVRIPTGLCLEIPAGFEGQIRPRSGLAGRGLEAILGTIDADYRGEVAVQLKNESDDEWVIGAGDRIAQLVIAPVVQAEIVEVDRLSDTERGAGGFGSTGVSR